MRRLVLQFSLDDVKKIYSEESVPENVESLEVLHILKQDEREFAVICRVTMKEKVSGTPPLFQGEADEIQILENDGGRVFTYFVRTRLRKGSLDSAILTGVGGYLAEPFEVRDGKATITFLGNSIQVKRFLRRVEKTGIPYKVVSLMDAKFSKDSPLAKLTEIQRRVLVTAYNLGYYDLPKRASSEEIAEKLRMRSSTFVTHRIKAERRLIESLVES